MIEHLKSNNYHKRMAQVTETLKCNQTRNKYVCAYVDAFTVKKELIEHLKSNDCPEGMAQGTEMLECNQWWRSEN